MFETRRLAPEQVDTWSHLLTPQAAGLADPAQFKDWRNQVWTAARFGMFETYGVFRADEPAGKPLAVLLVQEGGGHRAVMLGVGDFSGDALAHAISHLMATSAAVSWQGDTGPGWAERLADLGVRRFDHQSWVNRLAPANARLAEVPVDPAVVPWDDAWIEEAIGLVVTANTGTLAGLVLALPHPPTAAALTAEVRSLLTGEGKLMRNASFGYLIDGRLVGVALIAAMPEGPVLYELAVSAATRGRGAGKHLTHAAQRALFAAGHQDLLFWTTDANAPVQRISPWDSELVESVPSAYWLAP